MSMHAKLWISHLRKFLRFKKSPLKSQRMIQVAAVSIVALITVAGLVLAAHQSVVPTAVPQPAAKSAATNTTAPAPVKKAAVANAHGNAAALTPVTVTGCLEQNHDSFRLKDTSGADAPKSRNWKTGFVTKHSKTITIVDSGNRLKLGSHVGERVSVTGMLVDKEMQGRSLKRDAPSCD